MAVRVSQVAVEVLAGKAVAPEHVRVSQVALEVLSTIASAPPPAPLAPVLTIRFGGVKVYTS